MALRRQRQLLHLSAALSSALMQALQLAGVLRLPADSVREQVGGWMNVMCFGMLYPSMTQVRPPLAGHRTRMARRGACLPSQ
jgi:hypothetical protein